MSLSAICLLSFCLTTYSKTERLPIDYADTCLHCEPTISMTKNDNTIESLPILSIKYGLLLDTTIEAITNLSLYQWIDEWMGVRYKYGGDNKNGVDCSSFSALLYKNIYNYTLPRTSRDQWSVAEELLSDELKEGDLIFFKTFGKTVSHVGVYLGNNRFVHASTIKGVSIDNLNSTYYSKRFVNAGRVTEINVNEHH